jgi:hypothetical protein
MNAARDQLLDIGFGRGIEPHHVIHRRCHRDRGGGRQTQRRQQIIGQSMRESGQEIGARWRHQDQIRPACQFDVPHGSFRASSHRSLRTGRPDTSLKSDRRDELLGGRRHHDLHLRAAFTQAARQIGALIGRDTAGHSEQDAFALHAVIISLLSHTRTI